jgi:hypothetical protein
LISYQEKGSEQMKKLLFSVLAVFGLMLAMGSSAFADPISFNLTYYETGSAVPIADQVTVTVTTTTGSAGDWTGATVTFTPAAGSSLTSIDTPTYINVDPTGGTITCSAPSVGGCTAAGGGNYMGVMSFGTGAVEGKSSVTMTLSTSSGDWASAASVLTPTCPSNNSAPSCVNGYDDGSENDSSKGYNPTYFSQGNEAEVEGGTQITGYYTAVPEPSGMLLLGSGLLALGLLAAFKDKLPMAASRA